LELSERIILAIEASLRNSGYEVVQVKVIGGKRTVVGIDVERLDGSLVTIDDCVSANHLISAILDVEDFIKGAYTLEVSSPGADRPLQKISDFERFRGKDVKVELSAAVDGKRKFCGKLLGVERNSDDAVVCLKGEDGGAELKIKYSGIKKATVKRF